MNARRTATSIVLSLIAVGLTTTACTTGKQHDLAATADTALFLPYDPDYTVDIVVDEVDGKATQFGPFDQVLVDAGRRDLSVRLEYAPAAGTSLLVGGVGNLLLRASTNRTFRTDMSVDVIGGHEYRMIARAQGDTLVITVFDETDRVEVVKQTFELKDGQFERIF